MASKASIIDRELIDLAARTLTPALEDLIAVLRGRGVAEDNLLLEATSLVEFAMPQIRLHCWPRHPGRMAASPVRAQKQDYAATIPPCLTRSPSESFLWRSDGGASTKHLLCYQPLPGASTLQQSQG